MSAPASFWLYLEGSGPGERARRILAREGEDAFAEASQQWAGRVIGPGIFRSEIEEALGPADRHEADRLIYWNPGRPEHAYSFELVDDKLAESGYLRIGQPLSPPPEKDWPTLLEHLTREEATADEVLMWLGDPNDISGWWPVETWDYGDGMLINFRHCIVEKVDAS